MVIYTDGSAHPNPGPGGFGVAVYYADKLIKTYSEQCEQTTNNREEIKAILWAMKNYGTLDDTDWYQEPVVYTDSAYCYNTFTNWMFSWERNGWAKADNKPIQNLDLIKEYFGLYQEGYRINLRLVKGHAGVEGNEIADALATGKYKGSE
jgi:ribonuclease HI